MKTTTKITEDAIETPRGVYRLPRCQRIDRGRDTEKLYRLESRRNESIIKAAEELAAVLKHSRADFWIETLPEALYNVLDSYEKGSSVAAAVAYLQRQGYRVERLPDNRDE